MDDTTAIPMFRTKTGTCTIRDGRIVLERSNTRGKLANALGLNSVAQFLVVYAILALLARGFARKRDDYTHGRSIVDRFASRHDDRLSNKATGARERAKRSFHMRPTCLRERNPLQRKRRLLGTSQRHRARTQPLAHDPCVHDVAIVSDW